MKGCRPLTDPEIALLSLQLRGDLCAARPGLVHPRPQDGLSHRRIAQPAGG